MPKPDDTFTAKQRRFIDAYAGNGVEAARAAGYKGTDKALSVAAAQTLGNPRVLAAIRARQERENRPLIATRQDRQRFWTDAMQDGTHDMSVRLKASELLGRSEADFKDRVEHTGTLTLEQLVAASAQAPPPAPAPPTTPSPEVSQAPPEERGDPEQGGSGPARSLPEPAEPGP